MYSKWNRSIFFFFFDELTKCWTHPNKRRGGRKYIRKQSKHNHLETKQAETRKRSTNKNCQQGVQHTIYNLLHIRSLKPTSESCCHTSLKFSIRQKLIVHSHFQRRKKELLKKIIESESLHCRTSTSCTPQPVSPSFVS